MDKRSVAQVIGENCKRLRSGGQVTMESFASTARDYGLRWNTGRIGDFESGRVSPTLSTLYAVTAALSRALDRPVHIYELIHDFDQNYGAGDGGMVMVEVNETITVPDYSIAEALRGKPVRLPPNLDEFQAQARVSSRPIKAATLTEQRVARDLGVDVETIVIAAQRLWGTDFVTERDRLAGPDASPQSRGQVSRELKAQLRQSIGDSNGND